MNTNSGLVAYATRFGSTQEVAESVAATLREAGLKVDLRLMSQVESLDQYEAVVLVAAIYNAKWHAEVHQFLARHQAALAQHPVVIFTLGPLSSSASAMRNSRRQLDKELAKYRWLKPVAVEVFAGKYDPKKPGMNFFERLLPARDYRNWEAIRAWASALPAQLEHAAMMLQLA